MLIEFNNILDIIVCPVCAGNIFLSEESAVCKKCGNFDSINGKFALIDFQNSIVDKNALFHSKDEFIVSEKQSWIKKILFGTDKTTSNNLLTFIDIIKKDKLQKPRCLIIGGGVIGHGMENLYKDESIDLVSIDIYPTPYISLIADGHRLPFKSFSMDGVWIQAVLEHVLDPNLVVSEIYRVLKPNGIVYSETPFLQQVHLGPFDFCRFTHSGHRWLFNSFEEISSGYIGGIGTQMLWSIDHFVCSIFRSRILGKIFKSLFFYLRFLDKLCDYKCTINGASGFYFLGVKSGLSLKINDVVGYYHVSTRSQ
jgi:SAM-dependent methyltransferase